MNADCCNSQKEAPCIYQLARDSTPNSVGPSILFLAQQAHLIVRQAMHTVGSSTPTLCDCGQRRRHLLCNACNAHGPQPSSFDPLSSPTAVLRAPNVSMLQLRNRNVF